MLSKLAYQIELNAAIGPNKYVNKYYGMWRAEESEIAVRCGSAKNGNGNGFEELSHAANVKVLRALLN